MTIPRPCGDCTFCCKTLKIDQLAKPAGRWCVHCAQGRGCKIYDERPEVCRTYQCVWTQADVLSNIWRPDRAKFLMESRDASDGPPDLIAGRFVKNELIVVVEPSMPDAWRREPYYAQLKKLADRKVVPYTVVLVRIRDRISMLFPEGEIDLGPNRPGHRINSGYEERAGKLVPFASFVEEAGRRRPWTP